MFKSLVAFALAFFWTAAAFAVEAEPEIEKAGPLTIVLFLAIFFGGCAWYAWYVIRNQKDGKPEK